MEKLAIVTLLILLSAQCASAKECRDLSVSAERLQCYDVESDLHTSLQQMAAVDIRVALNAADACAFAVEVDRVQRHLLAADLTTLTINDSRIYSRGDLKRLADDAQASIRPDKAYCDAAWAKYGPDAELPDNVFYKRR